MKRYPMAMADAYKFVKNRRSIISPNLNFMGQLWEFEQGLAGSSGGGQGQEEKEQLSVEMREVKESVAAAGANASFVYGEEEAPAATPRPSSVAAALTAPPAAAAFRWTDHKQVISEDPVTNGCGV